MDINELVPVEYEGQRLLTGKQLADFYGTTVSRIKDNFRYANSKGHFALGRDYFLLEGDALRQVRDQVAGMIISAPVAGNSSPRNFTNPLAGATRSVRVYTVEGAARHCKMLRKPDVFEVFEQLRRDYFQPNTPKPTVFDKLVFIDDNNVARFNAEFVARNLGFVMERGERVTTSGDSYSAVRWERVNRYLAEFGYDKTVGKGDFLPENMVYRLAMKANNQTAVNFQVKIAEEIMPSIRKYGYYSSDGKPPVVPVNALPPFDNERARLLVDLCNVAPDSLKEELVRQAADFILGRPINS